MPDRFHGFESSIAKPIVTACTNAKAPEIAPGLSQVVYCPSSGRLRYAALRPMERAVTALLIPLRVEVPMAHSLKE